MNYANGVYQVPCKINGLNLKFIFDTGASNVTMSLSEAVFMIRNGYLSKKDILNKEYYSTASGDITEGTKVIIRELEFGGIKLSNIEATIVHSMDAPLLLGQSALNKLGRIEIDYEKGLLVINPNKKSNDSKHWLLDKYPQLRRLFKREIANSVYVLTDHAVSKYNLQNYATWFNRNPIYEGEHYFSNLTDDYFIGNSLIKIYVFYTIGRGSSQGNPWDYNNCSACRGAIGFIAIKEPYNDAYVNLNVDEGGGYGTVGILSEHKILNEVSKFFFLKDNTDVSLASSIGVYNILKKDSKYAIADEEFNQITPFEFDSIKRSDLKSPDYEVGVTLFDVYKSSQRFIYDLTFNPRIFELQEYKESIPYLDYKSMNYKTFFYRANTIYDNDGNCIYKYDCDDLSFYNDWGDFGGLLIISKNKNKGLMNLKGELLIPPIYESLYGITDSVFVFTLNGKDGLISKSNRVIIPAQFDKISKLTDELVIVSSNEQLGLYKTNSGSLCLEPKYSHIENLHYHPWFNRLDRHLYKNLFIVGVDGHIAPGYKWEPDQWVTYKDESNSASKKGYCGIFDGNGKIIVPIIFDELGYDFENSLIGFKNGEEINLTIKYGIKAR